MTQLSWVDLVTSTLSQVRVVAVVWPTVQTGLNCSAGALLRFLLNRFQLRTLKQIVNAFTFRRGKKEFLLTMLVPLPWRLLHVHSLSRTGRTAYFLYSWSSTTTFLLLG